MIVRALPEQPENSLGLHLVCPAAPEIPESCDALSLRCAKQELLPSGSAPRHIDGRKNAPLREPAVQHEFHVAGALELLVDNIVHAAAGLDERRRQDRETAALPHIPRRAEEALRHIEGGRIQTAGERAPRGRDR